MADYVFELPAIVEESAPAGPQVTGDGIYDHTAGALARLVTQFRKPRIQAIVRCFTKPMAALEQALFDLLTKRSVDTAEGRQLVVLGKLVGQHELDVEEETFRSFVRARIRANKSNGMGEDIILVTRLVLTDYARRDEVAAAGTLKVHARNMGDAEFVVRVEGIDVPWDTAVILAQQFLREITGTGIRAVLEFDVQEDDVYDVHDNAFALDDATSPTGFGAGMGDLVSYPRLQAEAQATLLHGTWNHGHLCDNTFGGDVASWGGLDFAEVGAPAYDQPGAIQNVYDRGFGVGDGAAFSIATADLQADATDDFAFACAVAELGDQGETGTAFYPFASFEAGGDEARLVIADGKLRMSVRDGATLAETAELELPTSGPFAIMGVLERGTGMMRAGWCRPGGTPVLSAEVDVSGIGALTHAGNTYVGLGDFEGKSVISDWMASHGVDAGLGLSAGLGESLEAYAATMDIGGQLASAME